MFFSFLFRFIFFYHELFFISSFSTTSSTLSLFCLLLLFSQMLGTFLCSVFDDCQPLRNAKEKSTEKKYTPNMMKMLGAFTILYASSVKWFGFTVYCYCYIAFYSKFPNQSKVCVSYCCLVWICGLDGDYMSVFEYVFKFHIFCMTMASDTQQQQQKETREE